MTSVVEQGAGADGAWCVGAPPLSAGVAFTPEEVVTGKEKARLKWMTANAFGLGVGFVTVLQTIMLIEFGLDWKMHWTWIEKPLAQNAAEYVYLLLAMLTGGAILGSTQALILRRSIPVVRWIVATVAGFGIVAVTIQWPLIALGVLGAIPGPVEPLIITVGGGSFAGICQYLTLRRQGVRASKWLVLWLAGLVTSIVPTALLFMSLEGLGVPLSWPVETFLSGFMVAGVAASISGKALFTVLLEASPIASSEGAV